MVRRTTKLVLAACAVLPLAGCGDEEGGASDPLACDWDDARLMSGAAPEQPSGQQGPLAEALVGKWQHTHIIGADGSVEPLSDTTDIRFMFDAEQMAYCQHITGVVEVGPSRNVTSWRLDGDVIDLGQSSYTAVSWNETTMVWINDRTGAERYLLQRRE